MTEYKPFQIEPHWQLEWEKSKLFEEPGLKQDFLEWAEKLAPFNKNYHHHQTGESNGDAHLKSILFHHEVMIPITKGQLDFGPWQQVFYGEFDGQRKKRIVVKVMGE